MWNVAAGMDWTLIERLSNRWANKSEVALARQFVSRLDQAGGESTESGRLYLEVTSEDSAHREAAESLSKLFGRVGLLGLSVEEGIPARPAGPSVACKVVLTSAGEASVSLGTSDSRGTSWVSSGKLSVPLAREIPSKTADGKELTAEEQSELRTVYLADSLAEGVLSRLVRAQLTKGPRAGGKETYRIRLDNVSPLVLNGVALTGQNATTDVRPTGLAGISLPPLKSLTLPATSDVVDRLGLKDGVKAIAADLSAL
jgi:hypothetical protein